MIPGVRSIISYPAGLTKMDLKKYLPLFFAGSLVWNTVLSMIGYNLGAHWIDFWKSTEGMDLAIIAILVVSVAGYVAYRYYRKNKSIKGTEKEIVDDIAP
jgi:membrane protein DedA with SNARE-associated domain